jgi:hypothetical protein
VRFQRESPVERHRGAVNWERAERLLNIGGIRIEDNVLITDAKPVVLTADVPVIGEPAA